MNEVNETSPTSKAQSPHTNLNLEGLEEPPEKTSEHQTMKEVTPIFESKVDQQTIDTLRELLTKAESGELRSLIYVDGYRDGSVGNGWSGQPNMLMIGNLEDIKFNFFSQAYFPVEDDQ